MLRTTIARQARLFSTTPLRAKVVPDSVREPVKKADRAVSDTIVAGIEKGEEAAAKAKSAAGMSEGEVKGKASEIAGQAKGKANEIAGEAKGKKDELKGQAKKAMD
ncbi:hypothetical protein EJ05DRAFT_476489 [Pseudovirgaria hyperparasitica]|uniref:LEA domain-containing protein n=1 Tax=Pseudovirgaria hyperparasitica TaxID=470096 RepID=A0A6A6W6Q7_9PEZI|nr:uncharacterized protein EJ05DRAFT_476489 [Pseudovirgaria hyperparasitica]KAF2758225.1 hypothetical protein EJ05DRAFT_476489 [Pseudovirgaria hyperparasitica]